MDQVRVDRWLYAARIYRSRTQATEACTGGHVRVNGSRVRAHQALRVGDSLEVQKPRALRVLQVEKLAEKRLSAPLAQELYEDRSPPPPPKEERYFPRPRGLGRPTKRDRRALEKLRGR